VRRLLILACCLFINPLGAAQNPPAGDAAFSIQLASVEAPRYAGESALPTNSRAEWWYLNADLADREGRTWGVEWTLYRQTPELQAVGARGQDDRMMLVHAAITTPDGDYHEQQFSAGGRLRTVGGEGFAERGARAWEWVSRGETLFPARLSFRIGDRDLILLLESDGADLAGDIDSGERIAAAYSVGQPRIRVRGFVDRGADKTYLHGEGRFQREWNTPGLAGNRPALDRLSLRRDAHGLGANGLVPRHAKHSPAE
jgi:predicted secreted hydrolase